MTISMGMIDQARREYETAEMNTHLFYLDELIDRFNDNNLPGMTTVDALARIETQAHIDLYFQQTMDTALDYCEPETHADGTTVYRCMLYETQREVVVRPSITILSESDGMNA